MGVTEPLSLCLASFCLAQLDGGRRAMEGAGCWELGWCSPGMSGFALLSAFISSQGT